VTRSYNIAARMVQQAADRPSQVAVAFPRGDAWDTLNFEEMNRLADDFARGLSAKGVRRGDRVSLLVKPSLNFISLVFAVFKIGALPVLIDPGMGLKPFLSCVKRMQPRVLIGEPLAMVLSCVFRGSFQSVEVKVNTWRLPKISDATPFETAHVAESDEAAILFTSGSTGPAKGVTYTHGIFDAQTRFIQQLYGIEGGEVDLACFPLFGLFSMAMGMTVVIPDMDPSKPALAKPERLVHAIQSQKCTSAFGSPAIWKNVAPYCIERNIVFGSMKRILMAGAPIPVTTHEAFSHILPAGAEIHTPYGATESLPVASIGTTQVLTDTHAQTRQGAGTCVGRPVDAVEVRIIGIDDGNIETWSDDLLVPQGQVGEITVKGPNVTHEYKNEPGQTAKAKIRDGDAIVHRIGDLGYLDDQGRLWFCGRKSHRVKTAHGLLFPVPCEAIFNEHPDVYRTALVDVAGEPIIVAELEPGVESKHGDIARELLSLGAKSEVTRSIEQVCFHPSFPVDVRHNAKIRRLQLAEQVSNFVRHTRSSS
jgi:olefin beta-lactone synthetase